MARIKEKKFYRIFDILLWNFIGLLPIIYALITSKSIVDGTTVIQSFTSGVAEFCSAINIESNAIFKGLMLIFNVDTYGLNIHCVPMLQVLAFWATCKFIHLVLDILLLIPNMCSKFIDRIGG